MSYLSGSDATYFCATWPGGKLPAHEDLVRTLNDDEPAARAPWMRTRYWVLALSVVAAGLSVFRVLDQKAQASTDRVFRQALLTYTAARTLDAAISLAEGTLVAVEPAGVGITVSAGEVLEPLDDLVEQFSSVLLVSTTSLGIQSLLVRASAWWGVTTLLLLFLVARVATAFVPDRVHPGVRRVVGVGTAILLACRFAMPLYALGTTLVFERFLEPSQTEAVQAIDETSGDVRQIERLDDEDPQGSWMGRVSNWFAGTVQRLDVPARVEAFRARVSRATEHIMHLVAIFVLQTILLPLVFLWMLPKAVRAMIPRRS